MDFPVISLDFAHTSYLPKGDRAFQVSLLLLLLLCAASVCNGHSL